MVGMTCVPSCQVPWYAREELGAKQVEHGTDDECQDDAGVYTIDVDSSSTVMLVGRA